MGNYIYSIVVAGIFASVILLLSPDGQNGKTGRYISFIGAVFVALVILSPLPDLFFENDILSIDASVAETKASEGGSAKGEYFANLSGMTLSEIYGTDINDIKAYVYCKDSGEMEKILLSVYGNVLYDCHEAGEVLSEICGVKVEVEEYSWEGKEE